MYLIRWENNLQLPENILSNRFNSRQHDMHKKYAEQKLGETDAALNTSLKNHCLTLHSKWTHLCHQHKMQQDSAFATTYNSGAQFNRPYTCSA